MRLLVLGRGDGPQRGVPTDAVVERPDGLEDARLRPRAGGAVLVAGRTFFRASEERPHRRVVPAVPTPAHAARDPLRREPPPVVPTGGLAPPIRVGQQP